MGRPWWYDSYWQNEEKPRRRWRLPGRGTWVWIILVLLSAFLAGVNTDFKPIWLSLITGFIAYFCRILALFIFINSLLSWVRIRIPRLLTLILYDVTNPILKPLRRFIPAWGGLDFTPLVAMVILYFIPSIVSRLLYFFFD